MTNLLSTDLALIAYETGSIYYNPDTNRARDGAGIPVPVAAFRKAWHSGLLCRRGRPRKNSPVQAFSLTQKGRALVLVA